jgi:phosphohistidine phosphatase SixA
VAAMIFHVPGRTANANIRVNVGGQLLNERDARTASSATVSAMKYGVVVLSLLMWLPAASAEPFVVVVRHAEKAASGGNDPDLSEAGVRRAGVLAEMLKDSGIGAVITSEFKRTQETAAPTAKEFNLTPVAIPAKSTDELLAKLRRLDTNVLIVGHGNTIPEIIKGLGIDGAINIQENDYNQILVVTLGPKPQLLRLRYPNELPSPDRSNRKAEASPTK